MLPTIPFTRQALRYVGRSPWPRPTPSSASVFPRGFTSRTLGSGARGASPPTPSCRRTSEPRDATRQALRYRGGPPGPRPSLYVGLCLLFFHHRLHVKADLGSGADEGIATKLFGELQNPRLRRYDARPGV